MCRDRLSLFSINLDYLILMTARGGGYRPGFCRRHGFIPASASSPMVDAVALDGALRRDSALSRTCHRPSASERPGPVEEAQGIWGSDGAGPDLEFRSAFLLSWFRLPDLMASVGFPPKLSFEIVTID